MPPCKSYTAVHLFFSVLVFNLQPHPPGMDPGARCHAIKLNPTGYLWSEYESPLIKKFSRYRLLEYYITEKPLLLMVF